MSDLKRAVRRLKETLERWEEGVEDYQFKSRYCDSRGDTEAAKYYDSRRAELAIRVDQLKELIEEFAAY